VGTLSKDYNSFDNLSVIRQSTECKNTIDEYKKGKSPLKKIKSVMETMSYVHFAKEFVEAN
jgi:hypothetical protein